METAENQPNEKELRFAIVSAILDKSSFMGLTGKTIAEYSKDLEHYISTGELLDKTKKQVDQEWQTRSI